MRILTVIVGLVIAAWLHAPATSDEAAGRSDPGAGTLELPASPLDAEQPRDGGAAPPWAGPLRIASGHAGFVDEAGAWQLPLCAHYGEAFSAYVRRQAEVDDQLRAIRAAGYDCIRFWDHLGYWDRNPPGDARTWSAWAGKEVTPWTFVAFSGRRIEPTPDYYAQLESFLRAVGRTGLAVHHSRGDLGGASLVIPGGLDAVVRHSERVAALYDALGWDRLALYEGNNEDFQNGALGPDGLRRVVAPARARGAITALSAPPHAPEGPEELRAYGSDVYYVHHQRDGGPTDRMKRLFTLGYTWERIGVRLGWQGEPIGPNDRPGPGVTIESTEDAEELGLLAVMSLMSRQAWTYMSQCGVFWHCRIDAQSGFRVVPRMRAALRAFAPDVMSWPTLVHGARPEAKLVSPIGYHGPGGSPEGPARLDQAISGDGRRVVAIIYGGQGRTPVRNNMGCTASVQVVSPRDDETVDVETQTLAAGQTLELQYRVGRLLLASC